MTIHAIRGLLRQPGADKRRCVF